MAAPSAGCLVVDQGDVLLIKIMGGTYGPPGGSVDAGESAQCAAERETYEETGVIAHAGELAKRFDNGFHLYWCESVSGREIDITRPLEIKDANWFSSESFCNYVGVTLIRATPFTHFCRAVIMTETELQAAAFRRLVHTCRSAPTFRISTLWNSRVFAETAYQSGTPRLLLRPAGS